MGHGAGIFYSTRGTRRPRVAAGLPGEPGNTPPALDKQPFVWYIISMRATKSTKNINMRTLPQLPEITFEVTFDDHSTIFIRARDKDHARRIVAHGFGSGSGLSETIKKIEIV